MAKWYENQPLINKIVAGLLLIDVAMLLSVISHHSTTAILINVLFGTYVGVTFYALGSAIFNSFSWGGLANAAVDAILFTAATIFVTSFVRAIKYSARMTSIKQDLKVRAEQYRQSLLADPTVDQAKLQFATVTYDSKMGTYSYAYNSEIVRMPESMLNPALQGIGVKTSCAEIQAVNKALNAGSQLSDLFIYTVRTIDGAPAYACRVCTRVLGGNVAGIFTGLFR